MNEWAGKGCIMTASNRTHRNQAFTENPPCAEIIWSISLYVGPPLAPADPTQPMRWSSIVITTVQIFYSCTFCFVLQGHISFTHLCLPTATSGAIFF